MFQKSGNQNFLDLYFYFVVVIRVISLMMWSRAPTERATVAFSNNKKELSTMRESSAGTLLLGPGIPGNSPDSLVFIALEAFS